ncbi:MAG: hypothetical protein NVSMB48_19020 [Marmoricola sp.]
MLLSISLVGVGGIVFPLAASAPADAASALQCVTPYIYATTDSGVYQINTQTGASSGPLSTSVGNQLGITPGGGAAIWTSGGRIIKYDAATGTTTSIPQLTAAGVGAVAGGANPVNGLFYYGGFGPTLGKFTVFVYNPVTNTTVGPVATITLPSGASNGNGDIAFDSMGRAYVLVSGPPSTLVRIDQPLPTTTPIQSLTSTTVVSISGASTGPFGGYAFGADGYLYASKGPTLYKVDPNTGVVTAAPTITGPASGSPISDLGTCAVPNTVQVQKNLPNGRAVATDQFGLAVTGNGLSVGNTGTTVGSQTGIQNQSPGEIAGPVLGIAGRTYSIAETAAGGTNLSSYATTWSCVNVAAGSAVVASGSGLTGSFVLPSGGADIVCTFSNVPLVPKIAVSKASTTTSISTVGQQVPFTFLVTNTGDVTVHGLQIQDPVLATQGIGVRCNPSTLAPGQSVTCVQVKPYIVTATDQARRFVKNVAIGTAFGPHGVVVPSNHSGVVTPLGQPPTSIGHIALPNMGGPPMAALLAGLLAIFGGLFLLVGSRRRRE